LEFPEAWRKERVKGGGGRGGGKKGEGGGGGEEREEKIIPSMGELWIFSGIAY